MTQQEAESSLSIAKGAIVAVIELIELVHRKAPNDSPLKKPLSELITQTREAKVNLWQIRNYLEHFGWDGTKEGTGDEKIQPH